LPFTGLYPETDTDGSNTINLAGSFLRFNIKIMKKYILVLLLVIFIVPSIALASWWNPFSWKIFQKKEVAPQVQVEVQKTSEEKISDLQKQQQNSTTTTKTSAKTIQNKLTTKKEGVTLESYWKNMEDFLFPIADGQGIISFKAHNERFNDDRYYTKVENKWVWSSVGSEAIQIFGSAKIVCNGKSWTSCSAGQNFSCPQTGNASCVSSVATNNSAETSQTLNTTKTTTPIPPPTARQIADLTRICSFAISKGELTDICNPTSGVVWSSYYSSLSFRNQFDTLIVPQFDAMIASQSSVSAKQLQQTNCDYTLKSDRLALMTPWAGTLAIKEACGTATDADRIDYQTAELQHQLSGLQDTINKNKAEAFQRADLESLQSKPQTFGSTKWEVRFDNGGFGSVSNSLGQSYSFHCDSTSCITY